MLIPTQCDLDVTLVKLHYTYKTATPIRVVATLPYLVPVLPYQAGQLDKRATMHRSYILVVYSPITVEKCSQKIGMKKDSLVFTNTIIKKISLMLNPQIYHLVLHNCTPLIHFCNGHNFLNQSLMHLHSNYLSTSTFVCFLLELPLTSYAEL